ncbi:MAG: 16S rRNA (cytosine(1402)-N(4))-methyltransferase RsmH [Alphaproteobacteria bacterium]|nr:16S rRNA (cytosine(1402)-N(4))-methyltransferase RsmH [Alphaproteobacteria bacterium]
MSAHIPVLLEEVLDALQPVAGASIIDATFGRGGYTQALLAAKAARVLALDRDPQAIAAGEAMARAEAPRLTLALCRFSDLEAAARAHDFVPCDGIVFDIGVSSPQIDDPERGFSFRADGPLDMRMGAEGPSAADLVNGLSEGALADVLHHFGEERQARAIARALVKARGEGPITRTGALAAIVARVVKGGGKIDPATRTFQALRYAVNDELSELEAGLAAAERVLAPGGRLAVVTFNSLEDRIVKQFFAERSGRTAGRSRHLPVAPDDAAASFAEFRGPITASAAETARNIRARSAKLRAALRTERSPRALTPLAPRLPNEDPRR